MVSRLALHNGIWMTRNQSPLDDDRLEEKINVDRIEQRLNDLWEIGRTSAGGVSRLAYSEAENEAHEYLRAELPEEYHVTIDPVGNLFATRFPDAPSTVLTGSHLDSVHNAGRLDGTLGTVISLEAIEAVHTLVEEPDCPPTLAVFRAEESARFGYHTIGSRAALSELDAETLSATDQKGIPVWQAMKGAGFHPGDLSEPTVDMDRLAGFLEVHIEQGRLLDETGTNVGVVSSIRAPVRYRIRVEGESDHSGATPMTLRHDALAAAGEMIWGIESVANSEATRGDIVATVGDITAVNGAINQVCGTVEFLLDIRSTDSAFRSGVEQDILAELETIADRRDLTVEYELIDESEPVELSEAVRTKLIDSAEVADSTYRTLPSGGGHDAMNFQLAEVPTGLLFVPSIDGISHNPNEQTTAEAIDEATRTLAHALARRDGWPKENE